MADQTKIVKIDEDKFQILYPKDIQDFNGLLVKIIDPDKSIILSRDALKRDIINSQLYIDDLKNKLTLIDNVSPEASASNPDPGNPPDPDKP